MKASPLILSTIVSAVYVIFRFIEMRFVIKESKPLKLLFRDGLLVFLSVFLGHFILEQLVSLNKMNDTSPDVFINDPDF